MPMAGAFDAEVAHLALDHPGKGPQPTPWQQPLQDLGDGLGDRAGQVLRGKGLPDR
jgi:hypothetical protein